jgi:hypothetical protein
MKQKEDSAIPTIAEAPERVPDRIESVGKRFGGAFGIRVLLPLLLVLTLPGSLHAQFQYETNNGSITIIGYDGPGGTVIIPDSINSLPVTRIADMAFIEQTNLTSVTIADGVLNIGIDAFNSCSSLTNIVIGTSVTRIGEAAFVNCARLTSVTIPDSVLSIEAGAFGLCRTLNSATIGNSVTNIGDLAFADTKLSHVTIPNSVTTIGNSAFRGTSLTSVTIPNSVSHIGSAVFGECTNLATIAVDPFNPVFGSVDGVLFNASHTVLLEYPPGRTGGYTVPDSALSIGDGAFVGCSKLTGVTIGNGLTNIAPEAFAYCSSLTHVTIGNNVRRIQFMTFASCSNLVSVTLGNSVSSLGLWAFIDCTRLAEVYLSGDAPSIVDPAAFQNSTNAIVYYLPGTSGWGTSFGGRPTALWQLPYPVILDSASSFGVRTNQFGFVVSWATNVAVVVVEACTNFATPSWVPMSTNALDAGAAHFGDPQWTNSRSRFYRARSL